MEGLQTIVETVRKAISFLGPGYSPVEQKASHAKLNYTPTPVQALMSGTTPTIGGCRNRLAQYGLHRMPTIAP